MQWAISDLILVERKSCIASIYRTLNIETLIPRMHFPGIYIIAEPAWWFPVTGDRCV